MAEFRPFRGIRFHEENAGDLSRMICPPYDVISPRQQQAYYDLHPNNAIRLDFAKVLPGDDEKQNRYLRAEADFRDWLSRGVLVQDPDPCFYILEERFEDEQGETRTRLGIMGLKRLEENRPGASIRPHEATYDGPKQDRFQLMTATASNCSPIFAVYQDPSCTLEKIFQEGVSKGTCMEADGDDGVRRRLFVLSDPEQVKQIESFLGERPLLIADGHHRYETSLQYRDWRRSRDTDPQGGKPYDYTMMYITNMDSPGLCVYPAHRILRRLPGLDPETFIKTMSETFSVERLPPSGDAAGRERFIRELRDVPDGGLKIGCRFKDPALDCIFSVSDIGSLSSLFPAESPELIRTLDVSVLHDIVLGRCLGISREDQAREEFLVYAKGEGAALDMLEREPDLSAAFLLNPAPVQKIMQIAFAGILLPQKTTYFFPKVMTGLVFRKI